MKDGSIIEKLKEMLEEYLKKTEAGVQCHLNLMTLPSRADFLKFQGTDYYMLTYKYFSGLLRF